MKFVDKNEIERCIFGAMPDIPHTDSIESFYLKSFDHFKLSIVLLTAIIIS